MMLKNGFVRTVSVQKPSLADNTADTQRLEKSLMQELKTDRVFIALHLLQKLPSNLRSWNFKVKAVLFKDCRSWTVVDLLDPMSGRPVLGAAIDIGTTRVVMSLVDLESGQETGKIGFDNPQALIGPDILARIHYAREKSGLDELNRLVIDAVNRNISILCRENSCSKEEIYLAAGAGNTAMTHLFAGIEPFEIIREPYIPCVNIFDTQLAANLNLDINKNGMVFLFPNIGSYFGGDLIAGILYSDLDRKEAPCIMVDVGTNAEIAVGSRDFLIACAGAAGLDFNDLEKFYVAGTFGSFINPLSAISIGMLPDIDLETFEVLGNSSLGGAKLLLKDPEAFERIMKIRHSITYIELNVNQEFMNMFSGAKFYPHTDISRFPSMENKI